MLSARKLLKRDVAAQADLSPTYLSDLQSHRNGASPDVIDRLATAAGVKPAAIFPELVGWTAPPVERPTRSAR